MHTNVRRSSVPKLFQTIILQIRLGWSRARLLRTTDAFFGFATEIENVRFFDMIGEMLPGSLGSLTSFQRRRWWWWWLECQFRFMRHMRPPVVPNFCVNRKLMQMDFCCVRVVVSGGLRINHKFQSNLTPLGECDAARLHEIPTTILKKCMRENTMRTLKPEAASEGNRKWNEAHIALFHFDILSNRRFTFLHGKRHWHWPEMFDSYF